MQSFLGSRHSCEATTAMRPYSMGSVAAAWSKSVRFRLGSRGGNRTNAGTEDNKTKRKKKNRRSR